MLVHYLKFWHADVVTSKDEYCVHAHKLVQEVLLNKHAHRHSQPLAVSKKSLWLEIIRPSLLM